MIRGENIILTAISLDDIDLFVAWKNDADIKNNAMMHPFPVTMELEKMWFENKLTSKDNTSLVFAIKLKSGKTIGYSTLTQINYINRNCRFGIVIGDSAEHGKNYGKETLELLKTYCFETLQLAKITLEVISFNEPAIKLYEKCGFKTEGVLKNHFFANGSYWDVLIMSVFR